ncbi:MAG: substrate-binding domain-containing protein, partial [Burkholderiaceae bacterium]
LDTLRLQLGLRVPDDVAVVGFDNVPQSSWDGYPLTTIEQDAGLMTTAAVSLLIEQIEQRCSETRQVVTPVRLVERGTTRSH